MNDPDHTFSEVSMYGSTAWAATALGVSRDTFYRNRAKWEADGFPTPDPINKHYIKADVEAWVANRRRVSDRIEIRGTDEPLKLEKVNFDVL